MSLHIMNKSYILNIGVSGNLSTSEKFRESKPYGDTDVTLQIKTHDQNLQVCLVWETKIMLKQLFRHQNKEKNINHVNEV